MTLVTHEHETRPWGTYSVIDEGDCFKVKRIVVRPGHRLSYQRHRQRAEHWVVVTGIAIVTLDGREYRLEAGQSLDVPVQAAHRVANLGPGDLVFIEVQRGDYLGEDDIERLADDYGRILDT